MTKKNKLSIFAAMILCSMTIFAQNQVLQSINIALSQGYCERAQKLYNAYKQNGGKADDSIESRIKKCETSETVTTPVPENKPATPVPDNKPITRTPVAISNTSTTDVGVIIDGVRWATRNVDRPGTFADKPHDTGMLYQWDRKKAWSATDKEVTGWDISEPARNSWSKTNDPCPQGWRIPNTAKLETLLNKDRVRSEWTSVNGVNGYRFTDRFTGNTLFLPAAGYRGSSNGTLFTAGTYGYYWSGTVGAYSYLLYFYSASANTGGTNDRATGYSCRCVSE